MHKHALAAMAILGVAASLPARAGSLYVFGDSLSDDGNLYHLIGLPPAPYYDGHFSNGKIWVEYLPGLTDLSGSPADNFAYGGAFTGPLTVNGTYYGTNLEGANLPGISTEIAGFAASGGHFSAGDVVTLWGGANNYFLYAGLVQANPSQAVALVTSGVSTAISQLTSDATSLAQLGARTLIVPNVPDLGETPDYNGSALGTALGNAFANLHDAALPGAMESVHNATGANIIVLDTKQLLNNVIANPSVYGFTNVTQACINVSACLNGSAATQADYVFWDGVHPTTHAQNYIARYAATSLNGFESLSIPGQLGTQGALDFNTLLDDRMDALRAGATGLSYNIDGATGSNAAPDQKLGIFISAGGGFGNRNNSDTALGYSYNDAVVALGADYRFTQHIMAGLALGYGSNHANVNEGGTVRDNAFEIGLYGLAQWNHAYATLAASYGHGWYNTQTPGVIGNAPTGKPTGTSYAVDAFGGYLFPVLPSLQLGPEAGLTYTNTGLGAYTQSGDPLLTQSVDSQGYQQVFATTSLVVSGQWQAGGVALSPYAKIGAQILLSGRNAKFTSSFTDEPVVTLTSTYPKLPPAWAVFTVGANASITRQLSASASLDTTGFMSNGNSLLLSAGLRYAF